MLELHLYDPDTGEENTKIALCNPTVFAKILDMAPHVLRAMGFVPVEGEWYHPSVRGE